MRICFYGGPGSGKSTAAAITLGYLKFRHEPAELVTERCKPGAYAGVLDPQAKITHDQLAEEDRWSHVLDKVTLVHEAPALITAVFHPTMREELIAREARLWPSMNFFIRRDEAVYDKKGRMETLAQAQALDLEIRALLHDAGLEYSVVDFGDWDRLKGIIDANYRGTRPCRQDHPCTRLPEDPRK